MGLTDVALAGRLLRADPRLGGIWLRDREGAVAEGLIADLRDGGMAVRTLPASVDEEALLGGVDLAASLTAGRAVRRPGLLAEAAEALLIVRGAERMAAATGAMLASGLERGGFTMLLIDEGEEEAHPPSALVERLAFHLRADAPDVGADGPELPAEAEIMPTLAGIAALLGIGSARAMLLALRAVQAGATLAGRAASAPKDVTSAIRMVLAPRATRLPAPDEAESAPAPAEAPAPSEGERLDDLVLDAVRAVLPPELIEQLTQGRSRRPAAPARGAGERRGSPARGRPIGTRPGLPRGGARLALVDTIRAAAPWQRLRRTGAARDGLLLRSGDLRVRRFEDRAEALTIFVVDASGSSAAARLAEAKGAVELLLGRAYARRAEVALVAFRGTGAETLLPPTRSLTRARRLLAELPGGGGTPVAAGLETALGLAEVARRRGRTPTLTLLTDGRANIALDGSAGRAAAQADAERAARRIGAARLAGTVIDIGKRAEPDAARLAAALGMPCLHLPRADAAAIDAVLA